MGVPRTLAKGLSKLKEAAELRKLGGTQAERMARAAEQGNKIPAYHGGDGGVLDFTPGSNRGSMGAAYFNDKIRNAYRYAYGGGIDEGRPLREYRDLQREQLPDRNPVVQKVLLRMQKPLSPSDVTSDMVINALGRDRVISLLDNDYSFAAHIDENFEGSKKAFLSDDSNLRDWLDRYDDEGAVILEHDNEAIGSDRSGPFVFAHINGLLKDVVSKNGFDGFKFYDNEMGGITYVPLEPNQIRSVNADFNPAHKDSSNLLAGIGNLAAPLLKTAATGTALYTGAAALAPEKVNAGPLQTLGRAAPYLTSAALGGAAALQSGDAEAGIITRGGRRLIEAWHGSPHSFDKFDISKIGTGEGAQAYGHGLYFADAKETAGEYRKKLTSGTFRSSDGSVFDAASVIKNPNVRTILERTDGDIDAAIARARQSIEAVPGTQGAEYAAADLVTLEKMKEAGGIARPQGAMYRTQIDVDPDTLLDWDKPLSEQPDNIKAAWGNFVSNNPAYADPAKVGGQFANPTGEQFYSAIFEESPGMGMPARAQVTETLKAQGIPGIRYLDQMSRGDVAEPTYNYVMFDDKPISIVERGNATPALLGATAVGTGAGMYAASDAQAYNDYIRDEMEARTAADKFTQMRGSKAGYWEARRQELLDMVNGLGEMANNVVLPALDKPLQGYLGLAGTAGALAQGQGLQQALMQGANIARQPSEQTTYNMGGAVTDTLSPYTTPEAAAAAGALTNAGIQMLSPI